MIKIMFTQVFSPSLSWKKLKDNVIKEEIIEQLINDNRTKDLSISLHVQNRVAQLEGTVKTIEDITSIRNILSQHDGLLAIWDILQITNYKPKIADIGCGATKQVSDAIGIDRVPSREVDIIADLEKKLPLGNNSLDIIFAIHVLEHINNLIGLMNEMHRILKPTGILHIITPHWQYVNAAADPTHVRLMNLQTFKYFCEEHPSLLPWKPLMAKSSEDSIFADLQPIKNDMPIDRKYIARWFY